MNKHIADKYIKIFNNMKIIYSNIYVLLCAINLCYCKTYLRQNVGSDKESEVFSQNGAKDSSGDDTIKENGNDRSYEIKSDGVRQESPVSDESDKDSPSSNDAPSKGDITNSDDVNSDNEPQKELNKEALESKSEEEKDNNNENESTGQVRSDNDALSREDGSGSNHLKDNSLDQSDYDSDLDNNIKNSTSSCWITLNAKKHFQIMDRLDANYAQVRLNYQKAVGVDNFDKEMLNIMLQTKGAAFRAVHKADGDPNMIPAGINLGGYGMMRLKDSILFFHRVKLRNDTHFQVHYLHNDLYNMSLLSRISLNDLHLFGSYERARLSQNPSELFYTPTYGNVEFLLKNVRYNMEGRYRLLKNRLTVEHIVSNIKVQDILMTYQNNATTQTPVSLESKNLDEFIERLKTDIDEWLKDYFNDYLMYFGLAGSAANAKYQEYDKKKTTALNDYVDEALNMLRKRIRDLRAHIVKVPKFHFYAADVNSPKMQIIKLSSGVLRGLDTLHRRSVATGRRYPKGVRQVDAIVGFSKLKMEYKYEAQLQTGLPPLSGNIILTADEMTSHMGLTLLNDPEAVDITFDFLQQMKPESLTIDGPANRLIANFKHLLEHHIIAIMTNTVAHSVRQLGSLTKCQPYLPSQIDLDEDFDVDVDTLNNGKDLPDEKQKKSEDDYERQTQVDNMKPSGEDDDVTSNEGSDEHSDTGVMKKTDSKLKKVISENVQIGKNKGSDGKVGKNKEGDVKLGKNKGKDVKLEKNKGGHVKLQKTKSSDIKSEHASGSEIKPRSDQQVTSGESEINLKDADYVLTRKDSVEVEVPSEYKAHLKTDKLLLKYNERFSLIKAKQ